mmetsp:Transcript_20937/g.35309  ORF Transcript_20937/g.35309 Transcript_20937/m.35309 type:complete len:112 (+) Transcript_20937:88-423(+)
MDLKYFQTELNKYPVKRRSDYCKAYIVKGSKSAETPKALSDMISTSSKDESSSQSEDLDFWEYVKSKLDADDLQLSNTEKKIFTTTLQGSHKTAISNLNLEDLEVMAQSLA